ncbi:MAG: YjjG family noncanonical pyrimidine nucleotidase [Bacteroidota bacterium]
MTNLKQEKRYQHLLFDLDHTLWDFEKNSELTLKEIYSTFDLGTKSEFEEYDFILKFREVNKKLWNQYNKGRIDSASLRRTRFRLILEKKSWMNFSRINEIGEFYMSQCPVKSCLIEGSLEVLDYLSPNYGLHIITNGFEDTQTKKLESSGLSKYFKTVTTSQNARSKKPHSKIFDYAIQLAQASKDESIVIGDNFLTDIEGAKKAQIDQVFFNPDNFKGHFDPTYTISNLTELKRIL